MELVIQVIQVLRKLQVHMMYLQPECSQNPEPGSNRFGDRPAL